MTEVSQWMSWEGGVDLVALTSPELAMPNLIIHLARMVHTPAGSAPSGMVLWQPDPAAPPAVMGFVSSDAKTGAYFGPHIFNDTPFEQAPVLTGNITIHTTEKESTAVCQVGDYLFEVHMSGLGQPELIARAPSAMPPFYQQGVEIKASSVTVRINGKEIPVIIPPMGISGGPAAVVAPNGVYAR